MHKAHVSEVKKKEVEEKEPEKEENQNKAEEEPKDGDTVQPVVPKKVEEEDDEVFRGSGTGGF